MRSQKVETDSGKRSLLEKGAVEVGCLCVEGGKVAAAKVCLPREGQLTIKVNGVVLTQIVCTPHNLRALVLGVLFLEGVISGVEDVELLKVCDEDVTAEVRLREGIEVAEQGGVLVSGCGVMKLAQRSLGKVSAELRVTCEQVSGLMKAFRRRAALYRASGGVHCCALATPEEILVVCEDISRHSALAKAAGVALLRRIKTADKLLLVTGRVSSEMVVWAVRLGVGIVVTRRTPTDKALSLAQKAGLTLVGRAMTKRLCIYTQPERVEGAADGQGVA